MIVERMPILVNAQTSNANMNEQQEQAYNHEESPSNNERMNHVSTNEPEVYKRFIYIY